MGQLEVQSRTQPKDGMRVREAPGFLTVGQASRGGGGFVQQLQETAGNMETVPMGEGAGGFLLPKREVSDYSPALPIWEVPCPRPPQVLECGCLFLSYPCPLSPPSSAGLLVKDIHGGRTSAASPATWKPFLLKGLTPNPDTGVSVQDRDKKVWTRRPQYPQSSADWFSRKPASLWRNELWTSHPQVSSLSATCLTISLKWAPQIL